MIYAGLALLAATCLLLAWGIVRLRRGATQSFAAAHQVGLAQVPALVEECVDGFARMGEGLVLDDAERAAALLDRFLSKDLTRLKIAFARAGFDWYFVMPVGAALGELLRIHAGGRWAPAEGGGLCIVLPLGEGTATAHPFEKIVKQATTGARGDIVAYLAAARGFEAAAADVAAA